MSHKPYAIFQFGPNSTRYEILPPKCRCRRKRKFRQPEVRVVVEVRHV